ncbi:MAG: DNA polymerase, partial [Pirellulales bacterium]
VWVPMTAVPLATADLWPAGFERDPMVTIQLFSGGQFPPPLAAAIASGRPLCAHNAFGFDQHVWRAKHFPEPSAWLDTLPLARAAGFPGALDQLGKQLFGVGKDPGAALLKKVCRPDRKGNFPALTPADLATIARYNLADVLLLAKLYDRVRDHGEPDIICADQAINARGIAFDTQLAKQLIALDKRHVAAAMAEVERATAGTVRGADLRRVKFLLEWLAARGTSLPNLKFDTIDTALNSGLRDRDPIAATVLKARQVSVRVTGSKLEEALATVHDDGRLRDLLVYHAAHTGRWSGRGVQPQNLPKSHRKLKDLAALLAVVDDFDALKHALPAGVDIGDALSTLVRPCFRASSGKLLVIADYAAIEARGLAWCAEEQSLLEAFFAGKDVYCGLASQFYPFEVTKAHTTERGVGKLGMLGCGYSMSAAKFDEYAISFGINLTAAGLTAEAVVEGYRNAYPAIAGTLVEDDDRQYRIGGIWREVEAAARDTISTGATNEAGRCIFSRSNGALVIELPSGRCLHYQGARLEQRDTPFGPKPTIIFDSPNQPAKSTYGGRLVENVVQAICRDLLANSLVQCEAAGLSTVLHVHDETVLEVPAEQAPEALHKLIKLMTTPPAWADGFPLEAEGFVTNRYWKSPAPGAAVATARQGRVLA